MHIFQTATPAVTSLRGARNWSSHVSLAAPVLLVTNEV